MSGDNNSEKTANSFDAPPQTVEREEALPRPDIAHSQDEEAAKEEGKGEGEEKSNRTDQQQEHGQAAPKDDESGTATTTKGPVGAGFCASQTSLSLLFAAILLVFAAKM